MKEVKKKHVQIKQTNLQHAIQNGIDKSTTIDIYNEKNI